MADSLPQIQTAVRGQFVSVDNDRLMLLLDPSKDGPPQVVVKSGEYALGHQDGAQGALQRGKHPQCIDAFPSSACAQRGLKPGRTYAGVLELLPLAQVSGQDPRPQLRATPRS